MTNEYEEFKKVITKLKEEANTSMMSARRALLINDKDYDRALAYLKIYDWDSHGFKYEIGSHHG